MSSPTPIESDEPALWRAIQAAPADDAPWLVYADWLDDHGRTREAGNLRRFLPDVRELLQAGYEPPVVMDMVVRQEPDAVGWGQFLRPRAEPTPNPVPFQPVLDNPPRETSTGKMLLLWLGFTVFMSVARVGYEGARMRTEAEPSPPKLRLPPMFRTTDVAGHTFRLVHDNEILVLDLAGDGQAAITLGQKGRRAVQFAGQWQITFDGMLIVRGGPNGGPLCQLELMMAEGDRYVVRRFGERAVFTREPLRSNAIGKDNSGN